MECQLDGLSATKGGVEAEHVARVSPGSSGGERERWGRNEGVKNGQGRRERVKKRVEEKRECGRDEWRGKYI